MTFPQSWYDPDDNILNQDNISRLIMTNHHPIGRGSFARLWTAFAKQ